MNRRQRYKNKLNADRMAATLPSDIGDQIAALVKQIQEYVKEGDTFQEEYRLHESLLAYQKSADAFRKLPILQFEFPSIIIDTLMGLANCRYKMGHYPQTFCLCVQALVYNNLNKEAYKLIGRAAAAGGKEIYRGQCALQMAEEIDPKDKEVKQLLSHLENIQKERDDFAKETSVKHRASRTAAVEETQSPIAATAAATATAATATAGQAMVTELTTGIEPAQVHADIDSQLTEIIAATKNMKVTKN